jgi:serine/threonine protein kinase
MDLPPLIPDYDLLKRIGGGAYGEVWLVRSKATGALRAAKIVWRRTFNDERPFKREFEGIQRFERISREHPSQLALFHIGRNDDEGYFYYVMELADLVGNPKSEIRNPKENRSPKTETSAAKEEVRVSDSYLPRTLRADLGPGRRCPAEQVVEIGLALTEALSHLHSHGLVHRDVKPSNVIFVNGRPKLADIGLVTDASDQCSIVGTEGYLPPEGPGTAQGDLFALGKLLYEAATGQDRLQFPLLPDDLRSWSDGRKVLELNEIVLKACAPNVAERYGTAEAMHAELQRFAQGKSVRRTRRMQRLGRVARISGALLVGLVAVLWLITSIERIYRPSPGPRQPKRSTNALANMYYEQGMAYFDKLMGTNAQMAADCLEKAVREDPNFAEAWASLAWVYTYHTPEWNPDSKRLLPHAKNAALRALALNKNLVEPYCVLASYEAIMNWDWSKGDRLMQRALKIDPGSPILHLGGGPRMHGKMKEALAELAIAQKLDPRSITYAMLRGDYLVDAGRFEEALVQMKLVGVLDPNVDESGPMAGAFLALGRGEEAVEALRRWHKRPNAELDELAGAVRTEGPSAWWRWELALSRTNGNRYQEACAHAQLGETNDAIACLQQDLTNRMWRLPFSVVNDWRLNPIRSDHRFQEIVKAIGFDPARSRARKAQPPR